MNKKITILGAGAWGITLANLLYEKGCSITIWEFDSEKAKALNQWRSLNHFPIVTLPKDIKITSNLTDAIIDNEIIIVAVPSHVFRGVIRLIKDTKIDLSSLIFISATKGIENNSYKRMSEIILDELSIKQSQVVVLSGPTIAQEIAQKFPAACVVASYSLETAKECQEIFKSPYFRVYTQSDVIGVELGGALKNIFAIAAGICDGLGLGDNTKASLVTRGLKEIIHLGTSMGGKEKTFFGLSGLGDLVVTCFSKLSRNRLLGEKIAKGKSISESEKEIIMVAEGVKTTLSAFYLSKKYKLKLPIIEKIYEVLYQEKSPTIAIQELMLRDPKSETLEKDINLEEEIYI